MPKTLPFRNPSIAFLGLGSNLGDRLANMRAAVKALLNHPRIKLDASSDVSSLYETDAIGGPADQPKFHNAVVRIATTLTPRELLIAIQSIEVALGRVRVIHHGPRTIDIDILLYGERIFDEPGLQIPHPRMHDRRFVLEPLSEIARDVVHAGLALTMNELLQRRTDLDQRVVRISGPEWCA